MNGTLRMVFLRMFGCKSDPMDHTIPFLNNKNNLGLLINVDWFKPFKRSDYKVAALMLTVLTSPRKIPQEVDYDSGHYS